MIIKRYEIAMEVALHCIYSDCICPEMLHQTPKTVTIAQKQQIAQNTFPKMFVHSLVYDADSFPKSTDNETRYDKLQVAISQALFPR